MLANMDCILLTALDELEEALFRDQFTRGYLGETLKCTVISTQRYSKEVCLYL